MCVNNTHTHPSNYNRSSARTTNRRLSVQNVWVPRARIILKPQATKRRRTNNRMLCAAARSCVACTAHMNTPIYSCGTHTHAHAHSALNRVTIKFQSAHAHNRAAKRHARTHTSASVTKTSNKTAGIHARERVAMRDAMRMSDKCL